MEKHWTVLLKGPGGGSLNWRALVFSHFAYSFCGICAIGYPGFYRFALCKIRNDIAFFPHQQ